ncbi:MAG: transposase [Candidatus Thiodiazotropha sp. (ex Troendleina suluensis)]|nr:transposase [Candidatus Thiodiazotropha sp. (ex Troendleina suluensis)]
MPFIILESAVDAVIPDPRNPDFITHTQLGLLRQRVYGLGLGYEDLNDHKTLRNDPTLQTAVDREQELDSQSTLCRLEGRAGRKAAVDIHKVLIDQFMATMITTAFSLFMSFVEISCWSATLGPAISMGQTSSGYCSPVWPMC